MTYFYIFLAGSFTALSNLFIRKSVEVSDAQGGDPFLMQRLAVSGIFIITITMFFQGYFPINFWMISLGITAGLMLGLLMWITGQAVDKGPSALSFAILNSACIVPPLFMALLFGNVYGYDYKLPQAGGALLVLSGILWMSVQKANVQKKEKSWGFWITLAFGIHALFLSFFQWRALLFNHEIPIGGLIPFHLNYEEGNCFTLLMFFTAAGLQLLLKRPSLPSPSRPKIYTSRQLWIWGGLGGVINGVASFCTIKATEVASNSHEKSLIFPLFCVCLITLCNLWGRVLYREEIHWPGTILCFIGILVALY